MQSVIQVSINEWKEKEKCDCDWRDSSMVKITCYSCGWPGHDFQKPHGCPQASVTLIQRKLTSSYGGCQHQACMWGTDIYVGNHSYIYNNSKYFKKTFKNRKCDIHTVLLF